MPIATYEFTRHLIKCAKFASNEDDHARASALLMQAISATHDCGDTTAATPLTPHIRHRQGMVVKHVEGVPSADKYFDLSESIFDTYGDDIGKAITQRDRGLMWYQVGETNRGIELLQQALRLLGDFSDNERATREWIVTQGFLARTEAVPWGDSLDTMMAVREALSGGTKLIYELDNERAMLPLLQERGHLRDYADCRVRIFALYRLIVAKNHGFGAMDQLMEGDFIGAAKEGVTGIYRLAPRALRRGD